MVEIQWKPSELPEFSLIRTTPPGWNESDIFMKQGATWYQVGVDNWGQFDDEDADKDFTEFEILSVPPSWYDEWKIFDRNMPQFRINRRGEVRRLSHIEAAKKPASITEALVRRAFNSNPI